MILGFSEEEEEAWPRLEGEQPPFLGQLDGPCFANSPGTATQMTMPKLDHEATPPPVSHSPGCSFSPGLPEEAQVRRRGWYPPSCTGGARRARISQEQHSTGGARPYPDTPHLCCPRERSGKERKILPQEFRRDCPERKEVAQDKGLSHGAHSTRYPWG